MRAAREALLVVILCAQVLALAFLLGPATLCTLICEVDEAELAYRQFFATSNVALIHIGGEYSSMLIAEASNSFFKQR